MFQEGAWFLFGKWTTAWWRHIRTEFMVQRLKGHFLRNPRCISGKKLKLLNGWSEVKAKSWCVLKYRLSECSMLCFMTADHYNTIWPKVVWLRVRTCANQGLLDLNHDPYWCYSMGITVRALWVFMWSLAENANYCLSKDQYSGLVFQGKMINHSLNYLYFCWGW